MPTPTWTAKAFLWAQHELTVMRPDLRAFARARYGSAVEAGYRGTPAEWLDAVAREVARLGAPGEWPHHPGYARPQDPAGPAGRRHQGP